MLLTTPSPKINPEDVGEDIPFTDIEQQQACSPRPDRDQVEEMHHDEDDHHRINQYQHHDHDHDDEEQPSQIPSNHIAPEPHVATIHKQLGSSSTSTKVSLGSHSQSTKFKGNVVVDNFTPSQREAMLCTRDQLLDDSYILTFKLTKLIHKLQENTDENADILKQIHACRDYEKQVLAMYSYYHSLPIHPTSSQLHSMLTDTKMIETQTKFFMSFLPNYRESIEITSLSTLLRCYYIPWQLFLAGIIIQAIQFLAYIAIIFFYVDLEKSQLNRLKLAANMFASVSLAMAAISNFTPMLLVRHAKTIFNQLPVPTQTFLSASSRNNSDVSMVFAKQQSRLSYNLTHKKHFSQIFVDILSFFETVNLIAIFAATYILIPTLATPFGIILNATVIFIVHQLDEQVFGVWKIKLEGKYYIDNPIQEEYVIRHFRIREISVAFTIGLFIAIVFFY